MNRKPNLRRYLKPAKSGTVRLEHFTISPDAAKLYNARNAWDGGGSFMDVVPGRFTRLIVDGAVMMSDTPMEWRSNQTFMSMAKGNVLIGGLGIGLTLLPVLRKKEVKRVWVLEKSKDVIDVVGKQILKHKVASKLTLVHADVFQWEPGCDVRFDTVYMDIWPTITGDSWPQMEALDVKYRPLLTSEGRFDCWFRIKVHRMWREDHRPSYLSAVGGPLFVGGSRKLVTL